MDVGCCEFDKVENVGTDEPVNHNCDLSVKSQITNTIKTRACICDAQDSTTWLFAQIAVWESVADKMG